MFRFATSLAVRHGTLWVARWSGSWRVATWDLDGRALAAGFVVPPEQGTRVGVTSIAVDEDRRVWIVDAEAGRVRAFSAFGREIAGLPRGASDRAGEIVEPASVDTTGVEEEALVAVASSGARRHGLHLVRADGRAAVALRARDAAAGFQGLGRVAFGPHGLVAACEPSSGLVHVWRDGQFHFALRAPRAGTPRAVRLLADGRIVVASGDEQGGTLALFEASGRMLRLLARGEDGDVDDPEDLAIDASEPGDRRTRVVLADRSGARLQVWNLEGDLHGAFEDVAERAAEGP